MGKRSNVRHYFSASTIFKSTFILFRASSARVCVLIFLLQDIFFHHHLHFPVWFWTYHKHCSYLYKELSILGWIDDNTFFYTKNHWRVPQLRIYTYCTSLNSHLVARISFQFDLWELYFGILLIWSIKSLTLFFGSLLNLISVFCFDLSRKICNALSASMCSLWRAIS